MVYDRHCGSRPSARHHAAAAARPPATAQEIVAGFGLHLPATQAAWAASLKPRSPGARGSSSAPGRPRVLLNMVSTADGRATIGGRSGPIGGRADRELFHALRTAVDAVMVGADGARGALPAIGARETRPGAAPGAGTRGGTAGLHRLRALGADRAGHPAARATRRRAWRSSPPRRRASRPARPRAGGVRACSARGTAGPARRRLPAA